MMAQQAQRGQLPPRGSRPNPNQGGAQAQDDGPMTEKERLRAAYKNFKATVIGDRFKADILSTMAPEHRRAGIFDRMRDSMLRAARDNPKLLTECDWPSFKRAAEEAARRGLIFGDNEAWAIPYRGQVQFQLGWRGMIMLAMRSGVIARVSSQVVYEGDRCTIMLGSEPKIEHEIPIYGERGAMIGVYAVATYKDSMVPEIEFMSRAEVERIRAGSPGKNSPAWNNWFDEMARAKVTKRLGKRLPQQNPELFRDDDDGPLIDGSADDLEADDMPTQPAQLEDRREVPFDPGTGEVREPVEAATTQAPQQQRRAAQPRMTRGPALPEGSGAEDPGVAPRDVQNGDDDPAGDDGQDDGGDDDGSPSTAGMFPDE